MGLRRVWQTLRGWSAERYAVLLGVALLLFQAATIPLPRSDGHLLSSDGAYYYSYLRSALLDRDLDIENDIALYNTRLSPENPARLQERYEFSIGPAVLWAPFFVLGRLVGGLAHVIGLAPVPDGFSLAEEAAVSLGSVAWLSLGLFLLVRLTRQLVARTRIGWAVLGTFLISPALYYALFEPTMSHTLEFFSIALLLRVGLGGDLGRRRDLVAMGAVAGLVFLVRWQNIVFPAFLVPWILLTRAHRDHVGFPWRGFVTVLLGALPVVAVQFGCWKIMLGSFLMVPQGEGFLTPGDPHVLEVLFSLRHGLFSWTPGLALAAVGLVFLRPRSLALVLGAACLLDVWICGIAGDWWGGDAFGMRRLIGAVPVLALGMAAAFSRDGLPGAHRWGPLVIVIFTLWNLATIGQYRLGFIPHGTAPTIRQLVLGKFRIP